MEREQVDLRILSASLTTLACRNVHVPLTRLSEQLQRCQSRQTQDMGEGREWQRLTCAVLAGRKQAGRKGFGQGCAEIGIPLVQQGGHLEGCTDVLGLQIGLRQSRHRLTDILQRQQTGQC